MIQNAEAAMVPRLRELWLRCFSDTPEDVDYFFDHRFKAEESLVLAEGQEVAAMMFLLPAALAGGGQKAAYVYAFATHPDYRGRGIATRLLAAARERGRKEGSLTFLCPAEEGLVAFYAKRGFYPSFFAYSMEGDIPECHRYFCSGQGGFTGRLQAHAPDGIACGRAGGICLAACTAREYARIRSGYLKNMDIAWDERAVAYAVGENSHSGGECIKFLLPDGRYGAALTGVQGECLLLREVLLPDEGAGCLPGLAQVLAKRLRAARGIRLLTFRALMPGRAGDAKRQLVGMSDEPKLHGYLNLVLD